MDGIDATDRHFEVSAAPSPSLLTIVLDTNPVAWSDLESKYSLSKAITHLQVFINAHLAINHANLVAVIASHTDRAEWLYPSAHGGKRTDGSEMNGDERLSNGHASENRAAEEGMDANKYGQFFTVEQQIRRSIRALAASTTSSAVDTDIPTQLAGALTSALAYINKQSQLSAPGADPTDADGGNTLAGVAQADGTTSTGNEPVLVARVLIVSVSGDLSSQYISVMNAIFAAQRRHIPIDVLKLAGEAGFLQQACDATGGIYLEPEEGIFEGAGMLQTLMLAYLPDSPARRSIVSPGQGGVDFRAACFCHQKVVDVGFVCSVCLSIFCEPPPDLTCLTCGTLLDVPSNFGVKPAVIPRRKKKKKRPGESGISTPGDVGTPG